MSFLAILALAVGLAMDALAASIAISGRPTESPMGRALSVGLAFGVFQGGMPFLGWQLGARLGPMVQRWDHWIAFVLLAGIGGKMLLDVVKREKEENVAPVAASFSLVLTLAFATSIDAFAVGITLPMLRAPFALTLLVIGVTTMMLSILGALVLRKVPAGRGFEAFGGIVLVLLGSKILFDHLRQGI